MLQLQSAFGIVALLALAWIFGENRRAVSLRQMAIGVAVTFATAMLFLKVPQVTVAFSVINHAVDSIADATKAGTSFVFGYVGGGPLPFELKVPGAEFSLAFQALPVVLVMSVLTTLLFHWRILPPIVRGLSWHWNARSTSAVRPAFRPQPTSSSAKSRRRCSFDPISTNCRAAKCSL